MTDTIREARPDDAHAIAAVHVAGWKHAYRGLMEDAVLDALRVEERAARRRRWLEEGGIPAARCWVLEEEGRILGFANTGPTRDPDLDGRTHELYAIYLLPERIGTGRGARLMQHAIDDLTARGVEQIVLWVLEENRSSIRFYEAAGFEPDARIAPQPHPGARCRKQRLRRRL